MKVHRGLVGLLAMVLGCAAAPDGGTAASGDALTAGCQAAGRLTLTVIPTGEDLDWSSPNALIRTALREAARERELVASGAAGVTHFIGHTHVQLDCGELSIPFTGQTGGGEEWKSIADGFGAMFRDFPGTLNEFPGPDHDAAVEDVRLRTESGHLLRMSFDVNRGMCARLHDYYEEYKRRRAYEHFVPSARPRRFEGGGCATFAASFLDVGGLLDRGDMTPIWAQSVFIGNRRFSDFLGQGQYPGGSNLSAQLSNGTLVNWPKGVPIPARSFGVVVPLGRALDSWTGPEDRPFAIPGVHLDAPVASAVPLTLYDPQLMAHWVDATWQVANGIGHADRLGLRWRASTVGRAREIVADAACVNPPSTPFDGDSDNVFLSAE